MNVSFYMIDFIWLYDCHFFKMHNSALVTKFTKTLRSISPGLTLKSNNSSTKGGISVNFKNSEVALELGYLRKKLVVSNPPTQRKVKLRVKRFIEILVYRKTEFVFFFLQYMLQYFFILQNVHITVSQIFNCKNWKCQN